MPPELQTETTEATPAVGGDDAAFDSALAGIEDGLFGEHGEFRPAEGGDEPVSGTPQESTPVVKGGSPAAPGPTAPGVKAPAAVQAVGAEPPPKTWTKEAQEIWNQLPPAAQKEIARREGDIEKGFADIKGHKDIVSGLQNLVAPYMPAMERFQVNPWNNMQLLLDAQARLVFGSQQEKVAILIDAANTAGIDLKALINGQGPVIDDRYVALTNQVRNLNAQLNGVSTAVTQRQAQELEQKVWAFAQDEEAHPYFWDVAADIARLTERDPQIGLDKAYETAVWSNPVTRQKAIEAQTAKAAAESAKKHAAHAKTARNATSVNVEGNAARSGTANADEDLETTIRNSLAEIRSRG
jgi:hypothetical protein